MNTRNPSASMNPTEIVPVAHEILAEAKVLNQLLTDVQVSDDGTAAPANELWNHPAHSSDVERSQSKLLGLAQSLNRILRGPHDFLHELVASNWDKGALYCLLEHDVLDHIPLDGSSSLTDLANRTGISAEKLLPILRLAACEQIIQESPEKVFRHELISRELVTDTGLRAFIGFQ